MLFDFLNLLLTFAFFLVSSGSVHTRPAGHEAEEELKVQKETETEHR
jgi:hypothetical protein